MSGDVVASGGVVAPGGVVSFLATGIMSLFAPLPVDRVHFLNPGEELKLPDRTLYAFKPPAFDNPSTTGFYDDRTRALFSSDCFGALPDEVPENAADVAPRALREGQTLWSTIDAPWLHKAIPVRSFASSARFGAWIHSSS